MINVKMTLEAGECNGIFCLRVADKENNISFQPDLRPGMNKLNLDVKTPNTLKFYLNGKDHKRDTVVDPISRKIVKDKYVKVVDFQIDNKPFDQNRIKQMFVLESENNGTIKSSYWGFNGCAEFDLPYEDSLDLHLSNLL